DLLADLRRRARAPPPTPDLLRPRRRILPRDDRADRARVPGPPRPLRRGQPGQPARLSREVLRRFPGPRRRGASLPAGTRWAVAFRQDESFARQLDAEDPLAAYRERFHIPRRADGQPVIYFCGNSLGLEPKAARAIIERELDAWERLAVDAHFKAESPWYSYH